MSNDSTYDTMGKPTERAVNGRKLNASNVFKERRCSIQL